MSHTIRSSKIVILRANIMNGEEQAKSDVEERK
jgi:hypothetical protein